MDLNSIKLGVVGYPSSGNLGDHIQSIAAARLLPKVDEYVPREGMDRVDSKVNLLCNGFFMGNPLRWPPSEEVNPLFLSFHVTRQADSDKHLIRKGLVEYYKKFEPIGCRDKRTARMFRSIGVKAYFSSCLTTTLVNPYSEEDRTDEILLVDPFLKYAEKDYQEYVAQRMVPDSHKGKVVHLTHHLPPEINYTEKERIAMAEELLDRYAKAKLVITSRIHVALPCLGLGTSVVFVDAGYDFKNGYDRFDGIYEFFTVVKANNFPISSQRIHHRILRKIRFHRLLNVKPLGIDFENPKPNKDTYIAYAKELRLKVSEWLNSL